uniref:Uncharacterized protein n=1 Tax=Macaca fascicularis TaxID=9541 RepID=A0A7N9D244_MACFA
WKLEIGRGLPKNYQQILTLILSQQNNSWVHVHNVQICYICIHVPCWCAAPINFAAPINSSFTSG